MRIDVEQGVSSSIIVDVLSMISCYDASRQSGKCDSGCISRSAFTHFFS
jgi:hypothetical protein